MKKKLFFLSIAFVATLTTILAYSSQAFYSNSDLLTANLQALSQNEANSSGFAYVDYDEKTNSVMCWDPGSSVCARP